MQNGYYRFPTIHGDRIVFSSEGDLWSLETTAAAPTAVRLTAGIGDAEYPRFSQDGTRIAFSGSYEGAPEVFVISADGGEPKRLTYLGQRVLVCGWDPEGRILFATPAKVPFGRPSRIMRISPDGGEPEFVPVGQALTLSYGPDGASVLGRYGMISREPAHWKRYKGGTAGDMWVDREGSGEFERLIDIDGNVTHPLWVGDRIYFAADHEGVGNLYSCTPTGDDLTRHTSHNDYYVRHPSTDGTRIVYHAGADLFVFTPADGSETRIDVAYPSARAERHRKFVASVRYMESYHLHPRGHLLSTVVRGKVFTMGTFDGAVYQHGTPQGVRYGDVDWMSDGSLVMTSDEGGEIRLEHHAAPGDPEAAQPRSFSDLDIGHPRRIAAAPHGTRVAITNHRNELLVVDSADGTMSVADRSDYMVILGIAWSPDARWIAYGIRTTPNLSLIRVYDTETGETHDVTKPVLYDSRPAWDPEGKYLYFVSTRELNPVYDEIHFDLGFPKSEKPYLVTLQADTPSPLMPQPEDPDAKKDEKDEGSEEKTDEASKGKDADDKEAKDESPEPVEIDFEGIENRVLGLPVDLSIIGSIAAIKGKLLFTVYEPEGAIGGSIWGGGEPAAKAKLMAFDMSTLDADVLIPALTSFAVSGDGKKLIYRAGNKLRVIGAGEKPKDDAKGHGRKTGWVDLNRVKVSVEPAAEWRQMYTEAWRLQREHFWNSEMSDVDWPAVHERYLPLLDRVSTRAEFSDLMWEMQGELGTSHAYEIGGDYPASRRYGVGKLGADISWNGSHWVIDRIYAGDTWVEDDSSPLARAGVGAAAGDSILAINGVGLGADRSPDAALVGQAQTEIALTLADANGKNPRTVAIKTLGSENGARYRDWVEANRKIVHEATDGRAGYIHIPDMGAVGYAEFHRSYLAEICRDGLVVDVRYNGGGHVSALLLEKLRRRRIGYDHSRWFGLDHYPTESPAGPMVAITNENAGSDGDIFSHSFKLFGLGPLIGTRTWGGVIGINPRQRFVDGGLTTQPEFSFWFEDVGWDVENYGTDPDIVVEITPQDEAAGRDPQMETALAEIKKQLDSFAPTLPDIKDRNTRKPPVLK